MTYDSTSILTEIYVSHYQSDRIFRYDIDSQYNFTPTVLPVPPQNSSVCLARDLDLDGHAEVFLFDGDGFGNGTLRIYSAPAYVLRDTFFFAGSNVDPAAAAANVDADPYVEVFLAFASFGFGGDVVMLMDYDAGSSAFRIVSQTEGVYDGYGKVAGADFDNDGRIEFIRAGGEGYRIYEWDGSGLLGSPLVSMPGFGNRMVPCQPKSGGVTYLLYGYYDHNDEAFTWELLRPVGDNVFQSEHVFAESTGWSGSAPCHAADVDCDGLDELMLMAYPNYRVWEWDVAADSFVPSCSYEPFSLGGAYYRYSTDIDQNSQPEFSVLNPARQFFALNALDCLNCDSTGRCTTPPPTCLCACHADPSCDGMISDVLDVVMTIDVAFRGTPEQFDPGPLCDAKQSDVDCNSATDVVDVVKVISVAFRGAPPSLEFCDPCGLEATGHRLAEPR